MQSICRPVWSLAGDIRDLAADREALVTVKLETRRRSQSDQMRALHAAIDDPGMRCRPRRPALLKIQRDFPLNFPKSSLLIQSSDPHRGQMAIWLGLSSRLRRNQVEVLGWVRRRCKAQHVSFCRARSGPVGDMFLPWLPSEHSCGPRLPSVRLASRCPAPNAPCRRQSTGSDAGARLGWFRN